FPREQLHIMLLEDLQNDPRATFDGLCEFLDLDPAVTPANVGAPFNHLTRIRSPRLWLALKELRYAGRRTQRVARAIDDLNLGHSLPTARPPLPVPWREQLDNWYAPNAEGLADLLERDLGSWRISPSSGGMASTGSGPLSPVRAPPRDAAVTEL